MRLNKNQKYLPYADDEEELVADALNEYENFSQNEDDEDTEDDNDANDEKMYEDAQYKEIKYRQKNRYKPDKTINTNTNTNNKNLPKKGFKINTVIIQSP